MATIFDSRLPVTLDRFGQSAAELLDTENMEVAVEIELLSSLEAEL